MGATHAPTPGPDGLAARVEEAICEAVRKVKDVGDLALDADTAFEALGITSLELVTMTFEVEDAFGIVIKDQYLDDFRTVGEARDTVLALLAAAGRA
jgi:acyl carrier protein